MSDEYPGCERSLFWETEVVRMVVLEVHISGDEGAVVAHSTAGLWGGMLAEECGNARAITYRAGVTVGER